MSLVAITGGIGAGKTTLVNQFRSLGALVSDADNVAHSAYVPGSEVFQRMVERWGQRVVGVDGTIDRKCVAGIVFSNKQELEWLNGVVHPFVRSEIYKASRDCTLFCAVPLLFESGWDQDADVIISAWCPQDVQLERLRKRGWTDDESRRRIASQVSMDEKLRRADFGIITHCTWDCLERQCRMIYSLIS